LNAAFDPIYYVFEGLVRERLEVRIDLLGIFTAVFTFGFLFVIVPSAQRSQRGV